VPDRVRFLIELSRRSGRPLSFTLAQFHSAPRSWARVLPLIEAARADGVAIAGQVFPRSMGMVMSLDTSRNPFSASSTYAEFDGLPLEQRVAMMRRREVRDQILEEARIATVQEKQRRFEMVFPLRDAAGYEPAPDQSVAALAAAQGVPPDELAYDLMLAEGGHGLLYAAFANIIDGNLDSSHTMMTSDATIIGLGDGGAHYGLICDSSYPSFMLSYWGRDRTRGRKLTVPYIVKSLAYDTAAAVGLHDRGLIKPGYKADLNLIDFDHLRLGLPTIARDLPSGGKRLTQSVSGIRSTIVSGVETQHDGVPTGLLPGRLVRGPRTAAQAT
jgi:N-acyl-D-amino-acid deacylase